MSANTVFTLIFLLWDQCILERRDYFFNTLKSSLRMLFQQKQALRNVCGKPEKKQNLKKVENDKSFQ